MKEFRAVLTGVSGLERPIQTISNYEKAVTDWSDQVLKRYPQGIVELYVSEEKLLGRVAGKKRECLNCTCPRARHQATATGGNKKFGACACGECNQFEPL